MAFGNQAIALVYYVNNDFGVCGSHVDNFTS
jgi:hypothetical protein